MIKKWLVRGIALFLVLALSVSFIVTLILTILG